MKITTLEYFIAVAEAGSIRAAAQKLYLAQPETNCQGLFNQIYKKFTSYGLHHEAYA